MVDRLSGRNRSIVARSTRTTMKLFISERQGGGSSNWQQDGYKKGGSSSRQVGGRIRSEREMLSGRNRSIVVRRAGTTGKLLIKIRETGFKNQKWYLHTIQYQGGLLRRKYFQ